MPASCRERSQSGSYAPLLLCLQQRRGTRGWRAYLRRMQCNIVYMSLQGILIAALQPRTEGETAAAAQLSAAATVLSDVLGIPASTLRFAISAMQQVGTPPTDASCCTQTKHACPVSMQTDSKQAFPRPALIADTRLWPLACMIRHSQLYICTPWHVDRPIS